MALVAKEEGDANTLVEVLEDFFHVVQKWDCDMEVF